MEDRKGDRRLIVGPQNSPQNSYVFPLLHEVVSLAVADTSADKLDEVKLSAGYICRPCFRAFEKFHKLKQQVQALHEQLFFNAKRALPYLPTSPASSESIEYSSRRPEKECTTWKRRREELRRLRHAPVSSASNASPPVALSCPTLPTCGHNESHGASDYSTSQPEPMYATPPSLKKRRKQHTSGSNTISPPVAVNVLC